MLLFVLDSDGDTDPDTDGCGKGSRPGSSSFLTVSGPHVADGVLLGIDSYEDPSACVPYPGGIRADSPGSRSAPRVHVRKGNNPGGVEAFLPRSL